MDYTTNNKINRDLFSRDFLHKLDTLTILAKKLQKNSRLRAKFWQGKGDWEFSDFRNYIAGDDLRKIDWNIFRRLNELVIKEYETELPIHPVIILDKSNSMAFNQKFDYSCQIAASLVYISLAMFDKITFVLFPQQLPVVVRTYKGKRNFRSVFEILQNCQLENSGKTKETLLKIRHYLPKHATTIIISDFYDNCYFETLPIFNLHNSRCTAVQVVTKEENQPLITGETLLQALENNRKEHLIIDSKRLEIYQRNFRNYLKQLKNFCLTKRIAYSLIQPEDGLIASLTILRQAGIIR